jgi:hypothetical protein
MSQRELPADLRRFILTSIPSVPYLEAVLLLRAEPDRTWTAPQLAQRLYVTERVAGDLLVLLRDGAVAEEAGAGRVRFAPAPALRELIDQTAHAYSVDLVTVTGLIHSRMDRRAQQFADAFRFRKE